MKKTFFIPLIFTFFSIQFSHAQEAAEITETATKKGTELWTSITPVLLMALDAANGSNPEFNLMLKQEIKGSLWLRAGAFITPQ
ncbi:MAG: hypothetical protein H0X62_00215 [Bacteroidetes bacterium]|nr:hypothetical protein [Bacteroidota bacterium]